MGGLARFGGGGRVEWLGWLGWGWLVGFGRGRCGFGEGGEW